MFAEMVRANRRRLGLTQEELATTAGLNVRTIRKIEARQINSPRPVTVRLLADAFGLTGADRERFCQTAAGEATDQPTRPNVPAQLPADASPFTGRDQQLARLDELLAEVGDQPTALVISALSGTAGVGKTALAWAHRVIDRFPGGPLYVNLRGYDPDQPVAPADAPARLLTALGAAGPDLLQELEDRAAFGVLGPVQAELGGNRVRLSRRQERGLLALLLLEAGQPVAVTRLAGLLLGELTPDNARAAIQTYVSRLRASMAEAGAAAHGVALVRVGDGYAIQVPRDCVDAHRFTDLVASARVAPDAAERARLLRDALALWQGPALVDAGERIREVIGARWELLRRSALQARIEADLELGVDDTLVAELVELTAADPLSEPLAAFLMRALHRSGQRAQALEVFRRTRANIVDELGIEPGDELQQLHRRILDGSEPTAPEPAAHPPTVTPDPAVTTAPVVVPRQLPAPPATFTGRIDQLTLLDKALAATENTGPLITAVDGGAGVGKTALAVHWAHRNTDRFPDGQLHVDLRGYTPGPPLTPIEAIARFLRALGMADERIPTDTDEAAALYRSLLAGTRTLVLLDNAASADQVRPLLPGNSTSAVLVTGRDQLSGLVARDGARAITLDVLAVDDAHTLLTRMLGAERVLTEPDPAAELATLCGHLPLALRIAAAHLTARPQQRIADYVTHLRDRDRITALAVPDDPHSAVAVAFDSSYTRLPVPAQGLFRLLGVVPGPDLTADAAAALAGTTVEQIRPLLDTLARAHLIEEPSTGRYICHDLLRTYASMRARQDEPTPSREAARQRLLTWYLHTARNAAKTLFPELAPLTDLCQSMGVCPRQFDDSTRAWAWLDAERSNLLATLTHAARSGPAPIAWQLAYTLRTYWVQSGRLVDGLTAASAAEAVAQLEYDALARSAAQLCLGTVHHFLGRSTRAAQHYQAAAEFARGAGWLEGEAAAVGGTALSYLNQGKLAHATADFTDALALNRKLGRRHGQINNLNNLGVLYQDRGQLSRAAECFAETLALDPEFSVPGVALVLVNLGGVTRDLGRLAEADAHLTQALFRCREACHRPGEAYALDNLAMVQRDAGRYSDAINTALAARRLAGEMGDRRIEANTQNTIGSVQRCLGHAQQAIDEHQQGLDLARENGEPVAEVEARLGMAAAYHDLGQSHRARMLASQALDLACQYGYQLREGQTLTALAEIHLSRDEHDQARQYAARALDNHRQTGHRLGEARTYLVLGRLHQHASDHAAAHDHWRQAHALFTDIGTAEAVQAALLATQ